MAHMQLEIEKQQRKKSPIAEIVNTVVSDLIGNIIAAEGLCDI